MIFQAISHYRILKKLGAGGMGEVYLADDTQLDRRVAIKVLPSSSVADQQAKRRLVREAQAAAKLDHPNICSIYEVSEEGGTGFIVMQYVDGDTLASRLHLGRIELRDALNIAAQTADALAEAHSRGIIHRDIKPQNIMITSRGQVKVMDFGLAKAVAGPAAFESEAQTASMLTEPGMIVGTVPYMSPEQLKNEPLDARSDIFSFGAVLYEMVSGRQPFADRSTAATIAAILTREPPPLARYSTEAPAALGRVTAKALSKDREQRYQTMRDLATDLAACDREYERAQANAEPGVVSRDEKIGPASDVSRRRSLFSRPAFLAIALPAMAAAIALAYVLIGRGAAIARQPVIRSLAVLPLEDLSGDPAQEYFADGMTDALISNLAQIRALSRVISRTSVMRYKGSRKSLPEIAAELKVDAVIEGTVQRVGGRVRVSAKLIPAATDSPLWAREYERDLSDVLKLQSEVARAVADEIRIQVTPEERARLAAARNIDPKAHEAYLLARHHLRTNDEDLREAIGQFERAIQLAPEYAAAYAGLSRAWMMRGIFGAQNRKEVAPHARDAALKAVALDGQLPEAHIALSDVRLYDWDWVAAEQELTRALELDANSAEAHRAYADLLMALERHAEAIQEIQRAEQLDPLSSWIQSRYARVLYRAQRYAEALPRLRRAIDLDPNPGNSMPYWILGEVYEQMGRYPEALDNFEKARSHGGRGLDISAEVARVYARMGKPTEARRMLEELKANTDPATFATAPVAFAYAALGDKDEAFKVLFRLVEERNNLATHIKADPPLASLHSDPRWKELLRRMNLPPE